MIMAKSQGSMSANSVESLMMAEYISMGVSTHVSQYIKDG